MPRQALKVAMADNHLVEEIDLLREDFRKTVGSDFFESASRAGTPKMMELFSKTAALVERATPAGHTYRRAMPKMYQNNGDFAWSNVEILPGILKSLRDDISTGTLRPIAEIAQAEVFSDFLEMAHHLLDQGYKDPAVVLCGGVLEEHLRKLCERNQIETHNGEGKPLKADKLNAELARLTVISKLDQKNVTAWLDLRNKAAHGEFGEYGKEQAALLLASVRDFITRTAS